MIATLPCNRPAIAVLLVKLFEDDCAVSGREIGNLAVRKPDLEGVQRQGDENVVADDPDELDDARLAERPDGRRVDVVGHAMGDEQARDVVVDGPVARLGEIRGSARGDVGDDRRIEPGFSASRLWANHS